MRPPTASVVESYPGGHWAVYARPVGEVRADITFVRGVKTKVASLTTTDPFGPAAASLVFPAVSYLDAVGSGDLSWCVPCVDIDVVWTSPEFDAVAADGSIVRVGQSDVYTWEGYAGEWDFGEEDAAGGLTIPLIGALKQADNYLAKPTYPYQPLPYEYAIETALDACTDRRFALTKGMVTETARAISTWGTVPGSPGQVSLGVKAHGYAVKDQLRVVGAAVAKGYLNNGTYHVLDVPDVDHFTISAPAATTSTSKISAFGSVIRDRPSMFPDWWNTVFNSADTVAYPAAQPWLLPKGVTHGQKWTGMLTRDTGKFEPLLSNYVNGLLANMHTVRGQFTLLLAPGRVPYLTHRDYKQAPDASTLVVDALWPGVKISPRVDHTQQIGVIYAQGKATNGDSYTGMQVTAGGDATWYDPAAYRRQVHPVDQNPWLDKAVMRKEVMVNFSDGLDEREAWRASADHLQRFADPGVTATLTLTTDPRTALDVDADGNVSGDVPVPRQTIRAGQSIQVKGLFGRAAGVLFHITEASIGEDGTASLTLDSLYRDHLTVDQVRKRGRDSLVPYRMLSTAGTYDPKIPDLLYPWSYSAGSGVIPYGGMNLFKVYGPNAVPKGTVADPYAVPFPWTPYTRAYPPKKYPQMYVHCRVADHANASNNWANAFSKVNTAGFKPYTMLLAAAGDIKLFQLAAYDRDGNVKAVPFHVSLYYQSSVTYTTMPQIPTISAHPMTSNATAKVAHGDATIVVTNLPRTHGFGIGDPVWLSCASKAAQPYIDGTGWNVATTGPTSITIERASASGATVSSKCQVTHPQGPAGMQYPYEAGQNYPFWPGAWEHILPSGQTPPYVQQTGAVSESPPMYGVGTGYEKAGFWPGSSSNGDDGATGMFSDETGFSFDFRTQSSGLVSGVDSYQTPLQNQTGPNAKLRITAYVMIYCDADALADTYFLGRCFRKEYQG